MSQEDAEREDRGGTEPSAIKARVLGTALIVALNLVLALVVTICVSQWLLSPRAVEGGRGGEDYFVAHHYYPPAVSSDPYGGFNEQHVHPIYGFFFPLSPSERIGLSNEVVTLDALGFRGESRGLMESHSSQDASLGFMLGGSATFGYRASADSTTITGFMNRMQEDFLFVNAGVPSWNSTQELIRLVYQILPLDPDIVISYSMFNDIEQALERAEDSLDLPPGSPEYFDTMLDIVHRYEHPTFVGWLRSRLPGTARLVELVSAPLHREGETSVTAAELEHAVDVEVDRFIENEEAMYALSQGRGFRFVTVIQPMTMTHERATIRGPTPELYARAVTRALASDYCSRNCIDYSDVFDRDFPRVLVAYRGYAEPVLGDSIDLSTVLFADQVHLLDEGNRYVATRLLDDLGVVQTTESSSGGCVACRGPRGG